MPVSESRSRKGFPPARAPFLTWGRVGRGLLQLRALFALVVVIVVFGSLSPIYLTWGNIVTMSQHVSVTAILAVGMTFVILTAGIDLSVGSVAALSGMVAGFLISEPVIVAGQAMQLPIAAIVVIALAVGLAVGALNGVIITVFKVPPFIATLGMLYMARGAALLISNGRTYFELTDLAYLGSARWVGIPVEVYVMTAIAVVGIFVARRTIFGRRVYAIGDNVRAAATAGIQVRRVTISVYVISGGCAALAGLILAGELQASQPTAATTYELNAIAAVVLGGTSLFGGRGSVARTVAGAFVIGFLLDGMVLVNVSPFWQTVTQGAVIVVAVALDQRTWRGRWRRRRAPSSSAIAAPPSAVEIEPNTQQSQSTTKEN